MIWFAARLSDRSSAGLLLLLLLHVSGARLVFPPQPLPLPYDQTLQPCGL
jgi:hypothetical protein